MESVFAEHGYLILVFLVGIITGVIDAFAAIGGMIAIPSLILLGLPPHTAMASDRFGTLGATFSMFIKHAQAGTIKWKWVPLFVVLALIGGMGGTLIAVELNPEMLKNVLAACILITLPAMIYKGEIGVENLSAQKPKWMIALGLVLFLFILVYSGLVGMGTGTFLILVLCGLLGFTILQVQGTMTLPWIVVGLSSSYVFWQADLINWYACFAMLAGMTLGGYIGSHYAISMGNQKLKKYIIAACLISATVLILS